MKIIWIWMIMYSYIGFIVVESLSEYYVSKTGIDNQLCSHNNTFSNPCGTLYKVSVLIQQSSNEQIVINIIDGQNKTEILKYYTLNNTNNYDPRLPKPFSSTKEIIITFNKEINDSNDWYPQNIYHDKTYLNEYSSNNTYGFIRSTKYYNATIICNNCIFNKITSSNDKPLLYTKSSIYVVNNKFNDINISANIVYADHSVDADRAIRHFIFNRTSFINIISAQSVVVTTLSTNDATYPATLAINNCSFHNVSIENAIVNDKTRQCDVVISNTMIHISSGTIYYSQHDTESTIHINNIWIRSNQLNTLNKVELLHFTSTDITEINFINIKYSYNRDTSCIFSGNIFNSIINASCTVMKCKNPIPAINNFGQIKMNYITIDIDILPTNNGLLDPMNGHPFVQYQYQYDTVEALINNNGDMVILNMFIIDSICYTLISNHDALLSISNLSFNVVNYNPNALRSNRIIYQRGNKASAFINNSNFNGSFIHIYLAAGSAEIINSVFENSQISILLIYINYIHLFH